MRRLIGLVLGGVFFAAAFNVGAAYASCGYKSDGNYHCGENCGYKSDGNYHCDGDG